MRVGTNGRHDAFPPRPSCHKAASEPRQSCGSGGRSSQGATRCHESPEKSAQNAQIHEILQKQKTCQKHRIGSTRHFQLAQSSRFGFAGAIRPPALHQRPTRSRRVPTVSWVRAACARHVVVPDMFTTGRHICWMPVACHGRLVRPAGPTAVPRLRTPRSARRIPAAWPARAPTRTPARCGVRSARGTRH